MPLSKFNMAVIRKRAKRDIRKHCKQTVKLSEIKKFMDDYFQFAVIEPLIKYGKVQIDATMTLEIVGYNVYNHTASSNLLTRGITYNGIVKPAGNWNSNRAGVTYKIVAKDSSYKKGQIVFRAHSELSKRVHNHLKNTKQYYRIEK